MTIASGGGGPPPRDAFPRRLLSGDTLAAARSLIGARLVHEARGVASATSADGPVRRVGRIVEVEAYLGTDDRASHARMGRTARNAPMFGPAGVAYVYLVYGIHHCLNVVTGPEGYPAAVLVRAVEPLDGIEAMRADRAGRDNRATAHLSVHRLAAGPGRVGAAFGVDRSHTGVELCDPASPLRLEPAPAGEPAPEIVATPRIGIAFAGSPWTEVPWRLADARSPSLSRAFLAAGAA